MPKYEDDPLWEHFAEIWTTVGSKFDAVVIGGYGLVLKRRWLIENQSNFRTIVQSSVWPVARTTEDIDLVLGAEVILGTDYNREIRRVIDGFGWKESPNTNARNWQFYKATDGRSLKLEFQAPMPPPLGLEYREDRTHLKPAESMGSSGIHARPNPEAIGALLHPTTFSFTHEESTAITVRVPHPVNMVMMKLKAMEDRDKASKDEKRSDREREFCFQLAQKHANDIALAVAMTQPEEAATQTQLVQALGRQPAFLDAKRIATEYFGGPAAWGHGATKTKWPADNHGQILSVLTSWFS
jgi:hypothetical protein